MHPTKFDHGMILDQTSTSGIPISENATPEELLKQLTPLGAEMLRKALEEGSFMSPRPLAQASNTSDGHILASKITPEDRHIDWTTWTADRIVRYDRVIGRLWDTTTYQRCFLPHEKPGVKRITFYGPWERVSKSEDSKLEPGEPALCISADSKLKRFGVCAADGEMVLPRSATVEGAAKGKGLQSLMHALQLIGRVAASPREFKKRYVRPVRTTGA